jgi:hypothetical protein
VTRYIFLHPEARRLYPQWEKLVRNSVAYLRARAGADPDDPELVALIAELVVKSPEFAALWERYEVKMVGESTKAFQHPLVGAMTLDLEAMELANADGQRLVAYYAVPGTPDHDAVTLLDMAGSARLRETGFPATDAFTGWSRDAATVPGAERADRR